MDTDIERLDSAAKTMKKGKNVILSTILAVNPLTKFGKLRKLMMILSGSIVNEDRSEAYDVLWAVEKMDLFKTAEAEVLAARARRRSVCRTLLNFSNIITIY